jgi:DNA-binding response OmpR family regulator
MNDLAVLAIDDDPSLLSLVKLIFTRANYQVYTAANGEEGLRQFELHRPDLVLLDIRMPGLDGWAVSSLLRRQAEVPIIFLTALDEDDDIVRGLSEGAVDYVTKPFVPSVLLSRARSVLAQAVREVRPPAPHVYDDGYLRIELDVRRVLVLGKPVRLTSTEYRVLSCLLRHTGQVVPHRQILAEVWGGVYDDATNYLHVYIRRLRKKLEPDPRYPRYLLTARRTGYSFAANVDPFIISHT